MQMPRAKGLGTHCVVDLLRFEMIDWCVVQRGGRMEYALERRQLGANVIEETCNLEFFRNIRGHGPDLCTALPQLFDSLLRLWSCGPAASHENQMPSALPDHPFGDLQAE